MNPPTEQLIRDYLNRLSLAARGKLEAGERQSLLDRTRARIEAECGSISAADATEVRKALAGLGDPIAIIELEHAKVSIGQVREGGGATAMQAEPEGAVNGSPVNWTPVDRSGPSSGAANGRALDEGTANDGTANDGTADDGSGTAVPPPREALDEGTALLAAPDLGADGPAGADGAQADPEGSPKAGSPEADPAAARRVGAGRLPRPEDVSAPSPGMPARLAAGLIDIARNSTVELIAVLLMGVGGVIYPPIWLVGVALALPSRKWDIRDKFLAVTLPILLVIVGSVLFLVLGGPQNSIASYAQEAWLGAERLSRVLAFIGGAYLLWGLRRGRRAPKQPPWNVPHKLG